VPVVVGAVALEFGELVDAETYAAANLYVWNATLVHPVVERRLRDLPKARQFVDVDEPF
jgi:hypothetical protein